VRAARIQAMTSALYGGPYLKISQFVTKGRWSGTAPAELHAHPEETQITIISRQSSMQVDWVTDLGSKRRKSISGPAICVTPAGQPHAIDGDESGGSILMAVSPALMNAEVQSVSESAALLQERYGVSDPFVEHLVNLLSTGDVPVSPLCAESIAVVMVEYLNRLAGTPRLDLSNRNIPLTSGRLGQVIDYVRANLETDLSLVTLAHIAQMSTFQFTRQFRTSTGISPHQYVLQTRIEMAKELLRNRESSIADVAYACGFATQAHLATVFRRLVGVTPKAYRAAIAVH
jgi:AraC family transcriptional regulator